MRIIKIISLFIVFEAMFINIQAENDNVFKRILINLNNSFNYKQLSYYGFDVETAKIKGNQCEIIADEYEIDLLKKLKVKYSILSNDIYREYQEKMNRWNKTHSTKDLMLDSDFKFGSMGGYFTLEEIYKEFETMRNEYPGLLVDIDTIGFTYENRPIILYTFGDTLRKEHEVLITALHHAREPGGPSVAIYFLKNLLRKAKSKDKESSFLLHNRTLYVIPVVNPDGYYYNEQIKPNGGGMWRKNRALVADSVYGVDLNRNYGPYEFWDAPVNGSSEDPKATTFRGTAPFSENETRAIRDFVLKRNIKLALNYHTYGNLLLYPYSALVKDTPDSSYFRIVCNDFSQNNRYIYGRDIETVNYVGRGVSDDWFYWTDDGNKPKTFSITPEVGTVADNFWATPDRIYEQCRDNLYMNYQLLWSADINWRPENIKLIKLNNTYYLRYATINTGVNNTTDKPIVSLKSLNENVTIDINPAIDTLNHRTYVSYYEFSKNNNVRNGDLLKVLVTTVQDNVSRIDTMSLYVWQADTVKLFVDEKLYGKWDKEKWDGEYNQDKGHFVMSDSPGGFYENSDTNSLTLLEPINLEYNSAYLQFDAFWQIETNFDYGIVEISTDTGMTWEKLDTRKMTYGSGARGATIKLNETGFSGVSHNWFTNIIDLKNYLGKSVQLRFSLLSDPATNNAGWLLDNIMLITYDHVPTSVKLNNNKRIKIYPNPAKINEKIFIEESKQKISDIKVYDLIGKYIAAKIEKTVTGFTIQIPCQGMFIISIFDDNNKKTVKKLIVE